MVEGGEAAAFIVFMETSLQDPPNIMTYAAVPRRRRSIARRAPAARLRVTISLTPEPVVSMYA